MEQEKRIESYLLNALTATETADFEAEIAANAELATAVRQKRIELRALRLVRREALKNEMATWKTAQTETPIVQMQTAETQMRSLSNRRTWQWAAAAAIAVLVAFGINKAFFSTLSNLDLVESVYQNPNLGTKGAAETAAQELIRVDKYAEALTLLAAENDVPSLFLKQHCQYKLKNYAAAITSLRTILGQTSDAFTLQRAEWLLLLMKLANGERDAEFAQLMAKMTAETEPIHAYQEKAKGLIEKLN